MLQKDISDNISCVLFQEDNGVFLFPLFKSYPVPKEYIPSLVCKPATKQGRNEILLYTGRQRDMLVEFALQLLLGDSGIRGIPLDGEERRVAGEVSQGIL